MPPYNDRAAVVQYLADAATLSPEAQNSVVWRKNISLALKRFILLKPSEKDFITAMEGIKITPEILYTLTLYKPSGKK